LIPKSGLLSFIFFGGAGIGGETQDLALARQVLSALYLATQSALFALVIFEIRALTLCWGEPGQKSYHIAGDDRSACLAIG
jgi:hypothetical protein